MSQRVQSAAWRILVVEDDEVDALLFDRLLTASGQRFQTEVCSSLREAVQWLHDHEFDVVLLDQSLPDGQGLQGIGHIHQQHPDVPIVMMTGLDDDEVASRAVECGAADYLVKGESAPTDLAKSLRRVIDAPSG